MVIKSIKIKLTCNSKWPSRFCLIKQAGLARSWHENCPQRAKGLSGKSSTWPKTAVALAPIPPIRTKSGFVQFHLQDYSVYTIHR